MEKEKWTKDKLIQELIDNSRTLPKSMEGIEKALILLNDTNKSHFARENENYKIIADLVSGNSAFIKIVSVVLFVLLAAVVIIAGAEKALKFIPIL